MNLLRSAFFLPVVLTFLLLAKSASAAAISINGSCKVGNCNSPTSIGIGKSAVGSFSFNYTFGNGDKYNVSGSYDNSYSPQHLFFDPTAIYIGNGGDPLANSKGGDTLSLVMLQNFFDPTVGVWDGSYCEHFPFNVEAGGTATGNAYFDNDAIGLLVGTPGFSNQSLCRNITFSTSQNLSDVMDAQMIFNFTFAPGSAPGAIIAAPSPEPSEVMMIWIALTILPFVARRIIRNKG